MIEFISLHKITFHLVFELLAYSIGFNYYLYLKSKVSDPLNQEQRLSIIVGGLFGAAIGSKLLGILEHPELFAIISSHIEYVFAAKTVVGGLLGGLIGVEISKKLLRIATATGDLFCYPLICGIMIGRIGCFLAGIEDGTWGNPTDFFTGIDGGNGIKYHPTPLYEIAYLASIWAVIYAISCYKTLQNGDKFKLFMALYLSWRLLIDFIKPSASIPYINLSAIQIACLGGLLYYSLIYIKKIRTQNGR